MDLVRPALEHLRSYRPALERGWSPDNIRFDERMVDREAAGGPITLADGSQARRLPGYRLWMWDGEFCGSIGFRWQPGTNALPATVLGHIGYAVVPWRSPPIPTTSPRRR